jgi:hypothetical protein
MESKRELNRFPGTQFTIAMKPLYFVIQSVLSQVWTSFPLCKFRTLLFSVILAIGDNNS